ncbi:hypothetical protein NHP164001_10670 [Helicobacter trogontum]|uniref:Uncharacterized protein n=1 Tax=Helicobacter trogontum TaxID=50960 RepID=A0ABQ0D3Z1_9HELI
MGYQEIKGLLSIFAILFIIFASNVRLKQFGNVLVTLILVIMIYELGDTHIYYSCLIIGVIIANTRFHFALSVMQKILKLSGLKKITYANLTKK